MNRIADALDSLGRHLIWWAVKLRLQAGRTRG